MVAAFTLNWSDIAVRSAPHSDGQASELTDRGTRNGRRFGMQHDRKIVTSHLSGLVIQNGISVDVLIYRLEDSDEWALGGGDKHRLGRSFPLGRGGSRRVCPHSQRRRDLVFSSRPSCTGLSE